MVIILSLAVVWWLSGLIPSSLMEVRFYRTCDREYDFDLFLKTAVASILGPIWSYMVWRILIR